MTYLCYSIGVSQNTVGRSVLLASLTKLFSEIKCVCVEYFHVNKVEQILRSHQDCIHMSCRRYS